MTPHSLSRSSENCPECGSDDNTVYDSRPSRLGRRRRRRCNICRATWSTVELSHTLVRKLTKALTCIAPLLSKTETQIGEMRTIVQAGVDSIGDQETDNG